MTRGAAIAILLVAVLVTGWSSFFVVDESEVAIVTQFGKYQRTVGVQGEDGVFRPSPGLKFKTPFVQTVTRMDARILGSDTRRDEYLTLDKKRVVADPITRWRITDPLTYFKTVHNVEGAKRRLDDIVKSELRDELAKHNFGDIIGNEREPLMDAVTKRTREKAKEYGIYVVDVRIKRADLPQQVQESVFARMRAERERVSKRYRSEGGEQAQIIRADTDKKAIVIRAKAYEKAQKLRGEGDAAAIKIYAEAYSQNPELYAFMRSLETYEASLDKQTTIVLSTKSPLFRYLGSPGKF